MAREHATVWINPNELFHKLVAATRDELIVASPSPGALEEVAEGLEDGDFDVLQDSDVIIQWDDVLKIRSNRKAVDVDITYKDDGEDESMNIDFASQEERDQFFQVVEDHLGDDFRFTEKELNRFEASLIPLAWVAGISFLTFVFYLAADEMAGGEEPEIQGRRSGLKALVAWLINVVGTTGVLVVGGICLAIAVFVLVKRIVDPPILMTLAPRKKR